MNKLLDFLETSYSAYHTVENAKKLLLANGFTALTEGEKWELTEGGKYFVTRGGSSLIAFTIGPCEGFKLVASHTDSPCFKLKENPVMNGDFARLNVEPYGGGVWYTFFDRPLKIAGRVVRDTDGVLRAEPFVSDFNVTIPSLAVHMNRGMNENFAPQLQTDLPLLGLGEKNFNDIIGEHVSHELYLAPAEKPFYSGADGELICSPRIDNLTSVYASLSALCKETSGVCVCACLDSEEIGSHTYRGAASDFLSGVLKRIATFGGLSEEEYLRALSTSLLISLDNAHSVHPNHPEKCDPTSRARVGGGVVIKGHAGGAYTTDAMTSAVVKKLFDGAGVKYQTFYNRSDMRSGGTLGAISLTKAGIPSVDLGLAQLAMHSAVETFAASDFSELTKGLEAFFQSKITIDGDTATVE